MHSLSYLSTSSIYLVLSLIIFVFFFFKDPATTEIYTLSLHDALPIWPLHPETLKYLVTASGFPEVEIQFRAPVPDEHRRSEEHTSELQSLAYLVCRLLLEKKKLEIK